MNLFLYKLLTQTIIILGKLREKLQMKTVIRNDRVFVDPQELRYFICCDCGLAHTITPYNEKINLVRPVRVVGYDYKMRRFSDGGTPFETEQEAIESTKAKVEK